MAAIERPSGKYFYVITGVGVDEDRETGLQR